MGAGNRDGWDEKPSVRTVPSDPAPGRRKARKARKAVFSRRPVLTAVLLVGTILLASCGGWAVYLNSKIADVPRVGLDLDEDRRPDHATGNAAESLNILLAGADAGNGPSIAEAVASGEWPAYSHRSDTIMVLHLTADRKKAYLISVPRDAWVDIEGIGMSKVNAAFAKGGPSLYVSTLEKLTGLRMDHLAIIDWNGFKDLTTAIGGVPVYIPQDMYDSSQNIEWAKGEQNLDGAQALAYVRTRYGLENGDFDRIERQQNFLRQTMKKLLSDGTTSNPVRLTNAVGAITKHLTVDDEFSSGDIRSLAMSLRSLDSSDVSFLTVPKKSYDRVDGQSIVRLDERRTKALFDAVKHDDLGSYLDEYGKDGLLGEQDTVR